MSLHFPPRVLSAPSVAPTLPPAPLPPFPPPPLDLTELRERGRARRLFLPLSHFLAGVCLECSWRRQGGRQSARKAAASPAAGPFYLCSDVTVNVHLPSSPHASRLPRQREEKKEKKREINNRDRGEKNRERIKVPRGFCPLSHPRQRHPPCTPPTTHTAGKQVDTG